MFQQDLPEFGWFFCFTSKSDTTVSFYPKSRWTVHACVWVTHFLTRVQWLKVPASERCRCGRVHLLVLVILWLRRFSSCEQSVDETRRQSVLCSAVCRPASSAPLAVLSCFSFLPTGCHWTFPHISIIDAGTASDKTRARLPAVSIVCLIHSISARLFLHSRWGEMGQFSQSTPNFIWLSSACLLHGFFFFYIHRLSSAFNFVYKSLWWKKSVRYLHNVALGIYSTSLVVKLCFPVGYIVA